MPQSDLVASSDFYQDLCGKDIGHFHVEEKLGAGGMAVVYRATDINLSRNVAIKIIRKEEFGTNAFRLLRLRFEQEARWMANLSHPNIVSIHDYGEYEGSPFLIVQYISGGTLKQRMGKPTPYWEATRLILPIARALEYAHNRQIIHRDVKPSNILITDSGEPMLSDFGIAKILEQGEGHTLTGTGVGIGTPDYMAPEQGLGKEIGPWSDVYSLGVVFYELVTGKKPYEGITPLEILSNHLSKPIPDPGAYVQGLPREVTRIIRNALAKKTKDRYRSMSDLIEDLEGISIPPTLINKRTMFSTKKEPPMPAQPFEKLTETYDISESSIPDIARQSRNQPKTALWKVIIASLVLTAIAFGAVTYALVIRQPLARVALFTTNTDEPAIVTPVNTDLVQRSPSPTDKFANDSLLKPTFTRSPRVMSTTTPQLVPTLQPSTETSTAKNSLLITLTSIPKNDPVVMIHHHDSQYDFWIDLSQVNNTQLEKFLASTGYVLDSEKDQGGWFCEMEQKLAPQFWNQTYLTGNCGPMIFIRYASYLHVFGEGMDGYSGERGQFNGQLSWNDANAYCAWAGKRLPTSKEMELAFDNSDGVVHRAWVSDPGSEMIWYPVSDLYNWPRKTGGKLDPAFHASYTAIRCAISGK